MTSKMLIFLCAFGTSFGSDTSDWMPIRIFSVDYPLLAVQSRTSGVVKVDCTLRKDGTVADARIVSGSLLLGQPILERIPEWKFKASRADGSRPSETIVLYFEFRLGATAAGPPKSLFVYDYPNRFTITSQTLSRTH